MVRRIAPANVKSNRPRTTFGCQLLGDEIWEAVVAVWSDALVQRSGQKSLAGTQRGPSSADAGYVSSTYDTGRSTQRRPCRSVTAVGPGP